VCSVATEKRYDLFGAIGFIFVKKKSQLYRRRFIKYVFWAADYSVTKII
jgi:hypothetical protein